MNYPMMNTMAVFLPFFLLRTASSRQQDQCFTASCDDGDSMMTQIRFPFRLAGSQQPPWCGVPGFELTCDSSSRKPVLRLKNSDFSVQHINYSSQHIWLNSNDPKQCLPRLVQTLNLQGSPFTAIYNQYPLFNCSSSKTPSGVSPIDCLSGADKNYTVVAGDIYGGSDELLLSASCHRIEPISVPVNFSLDLNDYRMMFYAPNGDIRLSWYDPVCNECEDKGGICGPNRNSDHHELDCKIPVDMARCLRHILTLTLGIPASLIIFGAFCFFFEKCNTIERRRGEAQNSSVEIPPLASQPNTILGLDQAAIESFPKTVIDESMDPNNTCPICLGEYKLKESIRTFPTCQHSFHSNCIDEWLHWNATCPTCRKYQKESPPVTMKSSLLPEP